MTYLYSILVFAGNSTCIWDNRIIQAIIQYVQDYIERLRGLHRTSVVHRSPSVQVMGTLAMDRNDQPNGICDPPMHSICLLCTL